MVKKGIAANLIAHVLGKAAIAPGHWFLILNSGGIGAKPEDEFCSDAGGKRPQRVNEAR